MKVAALAGGVGGAKMADGLARVLTPEDLTIIVNTGDDFHHLGLKICPDLDTVTYTLAGVSNQETGWGRSEESWRVLETLADLDGPAWFRLGDQDLALHLLRTHRMAQGASLSEVTGEISHRMNVVPSILPMTDDEVATIVQAVEGELSFQEYFVARRCEPIVEGFRFEGLSHATAAPGVLPSIEEAAVVVLCPSNPWVSIDPILGLPGLREALRAKFVIAVSPIVGGEALKGPAAKMFRELEIEPGTAAIAAHYEDFLDAIVIDTMDQGEVSSTLLPSDAVFVTNTIMRDGADRAKLAEDVLRYAASLSEGVYTL